MAELLNLMTSEEIDIGIITEPPINRKTNQPYAIISPFQAFHHSGHEHMIRAIIIINPNTTQQFQIRNIPSKTSYDYTTVAIVTEERLDLYITSVYLEPSSPIDSPENPIQKVAKFNIENWILAGDFNAQSPLWGSEELNKKGKQINELLQEQDLVSLVYKNTPTCITTRENTIHSSVIDATLVTDSITHAAADYENSPNKIATTDHTTITFKIYLKTAKTGKRNPRAKKIKHENIIWDKFEAKLKENYEREKIDTERITSINSPPELDAVTDIITTCITNAAIKSYEKQDTPNQQKVRPWWWTSETADLSAKIITIKRKMKQCGIYRYQQLLEMKKQLTNQLINIVKENKTKKWLSFMHSTTEDTIWATIHIIQAKSKIKRTSYLTNESGEKIDDKEAPRLLAEALFPNHVDLDEHSRNTSKQTDKTQNEADTVSLSTNHSISQSASQSVSHSLNHSKTSSNSMANISDSETEYIFSSVNPNKAPGKDMLNSTICERARQTNPNIIKSLYQKCLDLSAFPSSWKISQIVPIHKEKKGPATNPKNYRPIGLLSILGKGLEKIINTRITYHLIKKNIIHTNQHGFTPNKSTISALKQLLDRIESYKASYKLCTLLALDIAGAFDNLPWIRTINEMRKSNCPEQLSLIVTNYFQNRKYEMIFNNESYTFAPTKGCVQGSPLSPTFWNIIINPLINKSNTITHTQAYADDIVFLIGANSETEHNIKIQKINEIAQIWAKQNDLKFAIEKTEFLILKGTFHNEIYLGESQQQLNPLKSIKILGITLDWKLMWKEHIKKALIKATTIHKIMNSLCVKGMGVNSNFRSLCYNMVYLPTLTYGCEIWYPALNHKNMITTLRENQRKILVKMTGAYKQSNLADMLAITSETLIDSKIKSIAYKYLMQNNQETEIQFRIEEVEQKIYTYRNFAPWNRPNINVTINANTKNPTQNHNTSDFTVYTDGASNTKGTGASFIIFKNENIIKQRKMKLHPLCTAFQAEAVAIKESLEFILNQIKNNKKPFIPSPKEITIITDSIAVLQSLKQNKNSNPLINAITILTAGFQSADTRLLYSWVKSHSNSHGNNLADTLAKEACDYKKSPTYSAISLNKIKSEVKAWALSETNTFITSNLSNNFKTLSSRNIIKLKEIPNRYTTWFLTGKGPFKSYLKTIKRLPTDTCECGPFPQTPKHLLTECSLYENQRKELTKKIRCSTINPADLIHNPRLLEYLQDFIIEITNNLIQLEKQQTQQQQT